MEINNLSEFYSKALFYYNCNKYFDSLKIIDECNLDAYDLNNIDKSSLKYIILFWKLKGEILDSIGNQLTNTTYSEKEYNKILLDFHKNKLSDLDKIINKLEHYKNINCNINNDIICSSLAIIYKQKGRIYGYLRKYNQAILYFEKSIQYFESIKNVTIYKTEIADTYRQLSYIYTLPPKPDYKKAIDNCIQNAVRYDNKFALIYNTLGYVYMLSVINDNCFENIELAIENFEKAISLDPRFPLPWRNKGYSLFLKGIKNEINEEDKKKLYIKAEECIDEAIILDPNNPYPWQYIGYIKFELKNYTNAIRCFDNAIKIKPDLALAWYNKGITYDCLKEYEKAIECFDEAQKLFKKNIEYEEELAKNVQIEENYIKTNDEKRKLASVLNSKGTSLDSLGKEENYHMAIECFKESINEYESLNENIISNELSLIYFNKGYSHGNLQEYEKAVQDFEIALKKLPKDKNDVKIERADIYRNLAFAYGRLKARPYHKKARDCFENSIRDFDDIIETNNTDNSKRLALAYNSKGYNTLYFLNELKETIVDFDEKKELKNALNCFERSLSFFGDSNDQNIAYPLYNKGNVIYKIDNEKINEPLECFELATKQKPDFADGWYSRGVFKYKQAEKLKQDRGIHDIEVTIYFNEALEFFNKSIEFFEHRRQYKDDNMNPNLAYAWYNKGMVLNNLGQYEEALSCFNHSIRIKKEFAQAYINCGLILNLFERFEEALKYFDQALRFLEYTSGSDGLRKLVLGFKGMSYYLLNQYSDAIKCLEKVDPLVTNNFDILEYYRPHFEIVSGLCYYNIKEYSLSLKKFEKIIKFDDSNNKEKINKSIAHLFIGLCFYKMGESHYEQAIDEFKKAKEYDSKLAHAYYNLAVIYNKKKDYEKAKEELDNCIKNGDQKYSEVLKIANEESRKLKESSSIDWYRWWFDGSKIRKVFGIVLILTLITFIISPLMFLELNIFSGSSIPLNLEELKTLFNSVFTTQLMGWLIFSVGIIIALLLLPTLRTFKIGGAVEFETTKFNTDNINNEMSSLLSHEKHIETDPLLIETSLYYSSYSFHMPIVYNLESFRIPLKLNARVKLLNPVEPSNMPLKYPNYIL